jgi:hypothetical protein
MWGQMRGQGRQDRKPEDVRDRQPVGIEPRPQFAMRLHCQKGMPPEAEEIV